MEIGLNASAGISYNKFLAKLASDYDKPNGFTVITPEDAQEFLDKLPIEKFFGIGKVTSKTLKTIGAKDATDTMRAYFFGAWGPTVKAFTG